MFAVIVIVPAAALARTYACEPLSSEMTAVGVPTVEVTESTVSGPKTPIIRASPALTPVNVQDSVVPSVHPLHCCTKVGADEPPIVYAADAIALVVNPGAVAMAFTVVVELTVIAPLYTLEEVVGELPSIV
jgi:hypothetical protein